MTDKFEQVQLDGWSDEDEKELRRLIKKRLSVKRSKDHDLKMVSDMLDGESGENKLVKILNGNIEVKSHRNTDKYKSVFVELTDRGRASGIATSKAEWQAQVFGGAGYNHGEVIVLIKTERLRELSKGARVIKGGDASTGAIVGRNLLLLTNEEIESYVGRKK